MVEDLGLEGKVKLALYVRLDGGIIKNLSFGRDAAAITACARLVQLDEP